MTKVNQLMTGGVVTIDPEASGHDAVALMVRNKVRHLPVVDRAGRLCGIVTDRDLRHRLFTPEVFRSIGTVPVERLLSEARVCDVMSAPVISVEPDAELEEAARAMAEAKVGSLPVVDRGRMVGIVTETDLLRHVVGANACCGDVEAIVVSYP
jgi:acetoin utilization protein AcuB